MKTVPVGVATQTSYRATIVQPRFNQINGRSTSLTNPNQGIRETFVPWAQFCSGTQNPPIMEYIAEVEQACTKLGEGKAEEFRVEVKAAIKKIHKPQPNITKKERIALVELKNDPSRMVLTAHKGVAMVIMNTEDYKKKAEDLLNHHTYRSITSDPTMMLKNKLITLLKSIKAKGGMKEEVYKRLYPTGAGSPKFYGLPKIHKVGMPLRPIVSSTGTVTYETSKDLARILKPLVGKSPHHVQNNQDFIQQIKGIHLNSDQCIMSYDVKACFTSVPTKPATNIIEKLMEQDQELQHRTSMIVENIICLLNSALTVHTSCSRGNIMSSWKDLL